MSETAQIPFDLAEAFDHVRRGREIVAEQEQRDAIRKGYGVDLESDDRLLATFRTSLGLFEDHLAYLLRPARSIVAKIDPKYPFVITNV